MYTYEQILHFSVHRHSGPTLEMCSYTASRELAVKQASEENENQLSFCYLANAQVTDPVDFLTFNLTACFQDYSLASSTIHSLKTLSSCSQL
jgi:hypothetical protein